MTKFHVATASLLFVLTSVAAQAAPFVQINLRDLSPSDPAMIARVQAAR